MTRQSGMSHTAVAQAMGTTQRTTILLWRCFQTTESTDDQPARDYDLIPNVLTFRLKQPRLDNHDYLITIDAKVFKTFIQIQVENIRYKDLFSSVSFST